MNWINDLMGGGAAPPPPGQDIDDLPDDSEQVVISAYSLLKILKHCRAGIPHEVMGLMIGSIVDDFTVQVADVFAVPVMGAEVTVETIDEKFQQDFVDMLPIVGRPERLVGWYHSHPGTGTFLSNVDCTTQKDIFERQLKRSVATVCDPIHSVRGKVELRSFRTIDQKAALAGVPFRQTTSHLGRVPPIPRGRVGLDNDKSYYTIQTSYRTSDAEQAMLAAMTRRPWSAGLALPDLAAHRRTNVSRAKNLASLCGQYAKRVAATGSETAASRAGSADPKQQLEQEVAELLGENVNASLSLTLAAVLF
eukprot:TRINITY_DN22304_c0_g1_i1.p1 TRINITY_DN22304_c0_g1~~TRINITY_DN22304_c0_g1_i1.p1  ORF type:complete len:307 (+),score=55.42 TRINITY_DN22304_c0_g1_i1:203-1123(+)